jgi:hypothetical protein
MSAFNSMQAPSPATNYVASSGNTYVSTNTIPGIIFNVIAGDIASLQTFGCVLLLPRNQFDSGRSPTNSDDFTAGYGVGSLWTEVAGGIFTEFGCVSMGTSAGTASWVQLTTTSPTSPVISNVGSATYTVASTDSGKVLNINGGIFQAITFPAAATLGSGFYCTVYNAETTLIGKGIIGLWSNSFTLYPGQELRVINDGGTLVILDASIIGTVTDNPPPSRFRNGNIQLYVNTSTGHDNVALVDGLTSGRPFASLGFAVQTLYRNFDHCGSQPIINVAAGTYSESLTIAGRMTGASVFFIEGAGVASSVWKPASSGTPYCLIMADGAVGEISGFYMDNTGGGFSATAFQLHNKVVLDINAGMGFGSFGSSGVHIASDGNGSTTSLNNSYQLATGSTITVSAHIEMVSGCQLEHAGGITVTLNGSPGPIITDYILLSAGGVVSMGSSITWVGSPTTGCQKWAVQQLAFLATGGNAANIPGSVAGVPSLGASPTGTTGWVS